MSEFIIQNSLGNELDISNNDYFYLTDFSNQTFFESSLYSTTNAGYDGSIINSLTVNPRTIAFDLRIKSGVEVEDAKRYILQYLKPKKEHTIIWTRNDKVLTIQGVFQGLSMPRWTNKVILQATFYCEVPFWADKENTLWEIDDIVNLHYFTTSTDDMLYFDDSGLVMGVYDLARTRTYENYGDVETGLEITIHALGKVVNPIIYLNSPDNYIGIIDTLEEGDIVVISTERGYKDIMKNDVSILSKIAQGSTFIQLELGTNTFSISSADGETDNVYFSISYKQKYI